MSYRNGRSGSTGIANKRSRHDSIHEWDNGGRRGDSPPIASSRGVDRDYDLLKFKSESNERDYRSDPRKTLFIGRLNSDTTEDQLRKHFARFGDIRSLFLIRDILTGESRRYAFIEYRHAKEADVAYAEGHNSLVDGKRILVDREFGRNNKFGITKPRPSGAVLSGPRPSDQQRFSGGSRSLDQRRPSYNGGSSSRPSNTFRHYPPASSSSYVSRRYDDGGRNGGGGGGRDGGGRDGGGRDGSSRDGFNDGLRSRMHVNNNFRVSGRGPPPPRFESGRRTERR